MLLGGKKFPFPFYECIKGKTYCSASTPSSWALVWESKWHIAVPAVGSVVNTSPFHGVNGTTNSWFCTDTKCEHPSVHFVFTVCLINTPRGRSASGFPVWIPAPLIPAAAQYNLFSFSIWDSHLQGRNPQTNQCCYTCLFMYDSFISFIFKICFLGFSL